MRSTIRFRITAIAASVSFTVLAATGVALVLIQRQQLTANLDHSLEQRADQFEALLDEGDPEAVVANSNAEDRAVQLVAPDGVVVASTSNLHGASNRRPIPIADVPPDDGRQVTRTVAALPIEDDQFRVLSRRLDGTFADWTLHVAENADDLRDAIRALAIALALLIPLVVLTMTGLVWWLVGRTLRPVEAIRAQVTEISGMAEDTRVSVPPHDDEIARLAVTMNDMLDRLHRSADQQRRFVADASHELRTPLTRMRTELEVDLARPDTMDATTTHRLLLEETAGLQALVDDLLHLARNDARAIRPASEPLDLDDIVLEEIRQARVLGGPTIDATGISAAHVTGDRGQLARLVRNLLDNARRHARSRVVIRLQESGETALLSVADDGEGIPPEATETIFERFTRSDGARTRHGGGAGLGLAISREIAHRHGGSLTVESTPGHGATFLLRLPVTFFRDQ